MKIGLRIDVDTFRGMRDGVPALCKILAEHNIQASFFFSVGPDNMGRNIWRLIRPKFLAKMFRTNAATLYGWDILLRGTFFPGPVIGKKLAPVIKEAAANGHEIGFHAWDHYAWQTGIDRMKIQMIHQHFLRGIELLTGILGSEPTCSAAPGWKCTEEVLMEKEKLNFCYNSDCRGKNIFYPVVSGKVLNQPQIPVTLPTYDEVIGRKGITSQTYNDYLLSLLREDSMNVLTVHAETEGICARVLFSAFLKKVIALGYKFLTLSQVLSLTHNIPKGRIIRGTVPGREGWVAVQSDVSADTNL